MPGSGLVWFRGHILWTPNQTQVWFRPLGQTPNLFGVWSGSGLVQIFSHTELGPNPDLNMVLKKKTPEPQFTRHQPFSVHST